MTAEQTDIAPPVLLAATVDTDTVRLEWNEALDAASVSGTAGLTVKAGDVARTIARVTARKAVAQVTIDPGSRCDEAQVLP